MPENLNIKIDTKYQGKGLDDLKREFKDNQSALDRLIASGKKGTTEFKTLQQEQKKLGETIKATTRELKGLDGQVKTSSASLLNFGKNITIIGAGLTAFGISAVNIGKQLFQAAQEGAEFGVLLDSFNKIGGTELDLKLMRIASAGNLSKEELIKFTLAMKQLNLTIPQATTLLDKIEVQADATGFSFKTANEGVQSFISTGATKSLKGFLNIAELKDEVDRLSESWKGQKGELTELEEESIRAEVILKTLQGTQGVLSQKSVDNADKIASLSSTLANLKKEAELALLKGLEPLINKLNENPDKMESFTRGFENLGKIIGWVSERIVNIANAIGELDYLIENFSFGRLGEFITLGPGEKLSRGEGQSFKRGEGGVQSFKEEFPIPFTGNFSKAGEVNNPNKEFATPARELNANFNLINEAIINSTDSLSQFFSVLAGGEQEGGFKAFMKSIVNTFITSIQAMIFAAGGAASAKGITTFGLSLITDLPALAAAWAALELAKGTISGLAEGGVAQAGRPYIVGEREPEVFVPRTSGTVLNSKQLLNLANMGLQSQNVSNVYIGTDWDFVKFNKVMNSSFKNTMKYKLLN